MKKELLIFGANGALGKGVTESLVQKDYDKIYLFDFSLNEMPVPGNVEKTAVKDLSVEKNVVEAFSRVTPSKEKYFFLYSTIGGFAGGSYIWDTDIEEFDKMIGMNLKSGFLISKYFSGIVKESAGGSICFTAAYTGVSPEKKKSAYGSAKAALIHLVKSLALEGEEIKLSVNALAPYIIDTPANREWMKNADYDEWMKPKEIGEIIHSIFNHFHCITGNVINLTHRFDIKEFNKSS